MAFSRAKTLHGAPEGNACTTTNPSLLSVRRTVVSSETFCAILKLCMGCSNVGYPEIHFVQLEIFKLLKL